MFVTINTMTRKGTSSETTQNWMLVTLMVVCVALWLSNWFTGAIYILCVLIAVSLTRIINRIASKKSKGFTILTIATLVCWAYIPLSYVPAFFPPAVFRAIYGPDVDGFENWVTSILWVGAVGIVFTTIELFRTSRK